MPAQTVRTAWIELERLVLGSRQGLSPLGIERAYRRLLQLDGGQMFPPPNGRWEGERFSVSDGRHEYLAALTLGRERLLVAWLENER
jgi:hypothetical protein